MNVAEKEDFERVVGYLKKAADNNKNWEDRSAFVNVCSVLEQALERFQEDKQHPFLYLEIVKAGNAIDSAIDECCATDCIHFRNGTCPFPALEGKHKCPTIDAFLNS